LPSFLKINPLNAELNSICHLLALLGARHILHVSRIRVKDHSLSLLSSAMSCAVDTDIEPIPVHTMAQVVSCWPITTEVWVRSQTSPCRIYTGQKGQWDRFPLSILVFPCQYHSTNAAYSLICHGCCIISVIDSIVKYHSLRKSNKMQQCIKILFHIYMKLNMFRATHRPSSGA